MKKIFKYDEMEQAVVNKAGMVCAITAVVYTVVVAMYKYITTKDIYNSKYEIGLLMILAIVYSLAIKERKEINWPKTIWGKKIPIQDTKKSRYIRILYSALESLVGTVIFQGIFYNTLYRASLLYIISEGILLYIVVFFISYFYMESKCRQYIEWEKSLEE